MIIRNNSQIRKFVTNKKYRDKDSSVILRGVPCEKKTRVKSPRDALLGHLTGQHWLYAHCIFKPHTEEAVINDVAV